MKLEAMNEAKSRFSRVRYFTDRDTIGTPSKEATLVNINGNQVWIPNSVIKYAEIKNTKNGAINKFYWVDRNFLRNDPQQRYKVLKAGKLDYSTYGGIILPPNWILVRGSLN